MSERGRRSWALSLYARIALETSALLCHRRAVNPGLSPDRDALRARVLTHTVEARPWLCPEIPLRLITHACPLWYKSEDDVLAMGWDTPYWAFAWPGGQCLARHLLDHPELVRAKRVIAVGGGGAIEGIAALRAGAASVLSADIDPVASVAAELNAGLSGVALTTTGDDLVGRALDCDVVLLGDMFYDADLSSTLLAWLRGVRAMVLLGDPDRGNVPGDAVETLATHLAPFGTDVRGHDLRPARVARLR
jgi:predicted nicotinamide N-methyase